MKSALELARERADKMLGEEGANIKLTPEQIEAIDQLKKRYQAKWAEQEIALQEKAAKLAAQTDPQALAEVQEQVKREINQVREQIFAERDKEIEAVRQMNK